MRIGIDCYCLQSNESRLRGIGRYGLELTKALVAAAPDDTFHLYYDRRPSLAVPAAPNVVMRMMGSTDLESFLSAHKGDGLDALLILSPHESCLGHSRCKMPRIAAVVYDLIPDRLPENYVRLEGYKLRYEKYLAAIRDYDAFLAISEATRRDFIELRGFAPERITTIGAGVDHGRFHPLPPSGGVPFPERLRALGARMPYVLHVGGEDSRKGGHLLLEAWAALPRDLLEQYQLVYAYDQSMHHQFTLNRDASRAGIRGNRFLATGYVDDDTLAELYRFAAATAFPSQAEGLGFPLLESMASGVATIGGRNTSQIEVIGDAGVLVETDGALELRNALTAILSDRATRERYATKALERSKRFRWEDAAEKALAALRGEKPRGYAVVDEVGDITPEIVWAIDNLKPSKGIISTYRPALALFGPVPPVLSGISPYTIELARALLEHYEVTVFHDPNEKGSTLGNGHPATLAPATAFRSEAFPRRLYQMGNSHYHAYMLRSIREAPGVVTLHDLNLSGPSEWLMRCGSPELVEENPSALLEGAPWARHLVVHSSFILQAVKATVIPFGARPHSFTDYEDKFKLKTKLSDTVRHHGRETPFACQLVHLTNQCKLLVIGGIVHPTKMVREALLSLAAVDHRVRGCWRIIVVGLQADGYESEKFSKLLDLPRDIIWTGKLSASDFADVMAAADLAINLRRPPTNGETSASLIDALRGGTATIVSDVGSFAHYPDDVVRKVAPGDMPGLVEALHELVTDDAKRAALAKAGLAHIREHHSWAAVAEKYAEAIEEAANDCRSTPGDAPQPIKAPLHP